MGRGNREGGRGGKTGDVPLEVGRSALAVSDDEVLTLNVLSNVAVAVSDPAVVLDLEGGERESELFSLHSNASR